MHRLETGGKQKSACYIYNVFDPLSWLGTYVVSCYLETMKWWLRPDMTEKLLTGTLNLKTNHQKRKIAHSRAVPGNSFLALLSRKFHIAQISHLYENLVPIVSHFGKCDICLRSVLHFSQACEILEWCIVYQASSI